MYRPINITACLNGFVVQVGGHTLVFNQVAALCTALASYLSAPEAAEAEFLATPQAKRVCCASGPPPASPALVGCEATQGPISSKGTLGVLDSFERWGVPR